MGKKKRKHSDYPDDYILMKIRKLESRLRRRHRSPSDSSISEEERSSGPEPASMAYRSDDENYIQSDYSDYEPPVRSVVLAEVHRRPPPSPTMPVPPTPPAPPLTPPAPPPGESCPENNEISVDPALTEEAPVLIAQDILDALGESKTKDIPLGAKVPAEISKRWGRILTDGLSKEHKQDLVTKMLIPENFQLLKAPILNQEIAAVLTEASKNRDKRLENAQTQLGIGIAGITSIMSSLIEGKEIENVDIVKKLSETGQILLDLHYQNTTNRTKLITPILDKKFLSMIQDVKRDSHLFGENLGVTIKATKTAEKSGLQIKKSVFTTTSSKKFSSQTGSWRGPPRHQGQRAARPTASRSRGASAATPAQRRPQYPERQPYAPPTRPARPTRK